MNGKVTLTLNEVTYNVLAIVPVNKEHFSQENSIATIYMRKSPKGKVYSVSLYEYGFYRIPVIYNHGKWIKQEIREIQALSIPFNDDIIPPQVEQQPAVALETKPIYKIGDTIQYRTITNTIRTVRILEFDGEKFCGVWLDMPEEEKRFLPVSDVVWGYVSDILSNNDTDLFLLSLAARDQDVVNLEAELETLRAQLDAARAEITKLQADVVTLTAENRQLREAGRKLLYAHDVQFGLANPDQFPPGTSEYCLDVERMEAAKVFNSEVNS